MSWRIENVLFLVIALPHRKSKITKFRLATRSEQKYPTKTGLQWRHLKNGPLYTVSGGNDRYSKT